MNNKILSIIKKLIKLNTISLCFIQRRFGINNIYHMNNNETDIRRPPIPVLVPIPIPVDDNPYNFDLHHMFMNKFPYEIFF
jgi:hypothetical protein